MWRGEHCGKKLAAFPGAYLQIVRDENNEVIKFRAKNCSKVLPFKTSNAAVSVCQLCKKLKIKPKLNKSECDVQNTDVENRQNEPCIAKNDEVTLQKSDHEDLSEILKIIFLNVRWKCKHF